MLWKTQVIDEIDASKQQEIARALVNSSSDPERVVLLRWAEGMIRIRESQLPALKKLSSAAQLMRKNNTLWPVLKRLVHQLKVVGWNKLTWKGRLGYGAIFLTLVTIGNQAAGIAALGGAIGVPL